LVLQTLFQECELGYTFKNDQVFGFFGNIRATLSAIEKTFPQFNFSRIKQTHSDIIVQASPELKEADAHFSLEKNKALLIATADCTPVLIYEKFSGTVAAIHAGWRGVENQITVKTLKKMSEANTKTEFEIWIGPHILQKSFEVQKDVLDLLLKSSYAVNKSKHYLQTGSGFMVDLKGILESQIEQLQLPIREIHSLDIDTKIDLRFHSFRRDKAASGRNLSFITKI